MYLALAEAFLDSRFRGNDKKRDWIDKKSDVNEKFRCLFLSCLVCHSREQTVS